ncbi:MAG TPA: 2'-5' RNA ligase family protein [Bacteroidia bacterium]|nr:2'-5' RNA ligase family protein [Bacteroidia bacterium]
MKAQYFVALVLPGALDREIQSFKEDIATRFHSKSPLRSPAHITLVPPFHFPRDGERRLEAALEDAAKSYQPFEVSLEGFDHFSNSTLFIRVLNNEKLDLFFTSTKKVFNEIVPLRKRQDRKFHPHVTIGNRDWTPAHFRQAWQEYGQREFKSTFSAEKISLLRLAERWQIIADASLEY